MRYTTNSYRMGVDYRGISKTTLSFDELLTYSKVDNSVTDNNLPISFPMALPWIWAWFSSAHLLARLRLRMPATTPPTVTSNCNGYLSYSQVQNPRSSFPTERFSFQSTYIRNLSMSGSIGYSSGNNTVTGFNEAINGWASQDGHAREHDRRPGAGQAGFRQRELVRRLPVHGQAEHRR